MYDTCYMPAQEERKNHNPVKKVYTTKGKIRIESKNAKKGITGGHHDQREMGIHIPHAGLNS